MYRWTANLDKGQIIDENRCLIAQCWADFYDGTLIPEDRCKGHALLGSYAPTMAGLILKIIDAKDPDLLKSEVKNLNNEIDSHGLPYDQQWFFKYELTGEIVVWSYEAMDRLKTHPDYHKHLINEDGVIMELFPSVEIPHGQCVKNGELIQYAPQLKHWLDWFIESDDMVEAQKITKHFYERLKKYV